MPSEMPNTMPLAPGMPSASGQPAAAPVSAVKDEIYVMPEKFHPAVKKSSGKSLLLLLAALVLVLIVASIMFLINFWQVASEQSARDNQEQVPVIISTETNTELQATSTQATSTEEVVSESTSTPETAATTTEQVITTNSLPVPSIDTDNDGLTDLEEGIMGTSPLKPDTDGDGYNDGIEIANGYNPLKATGEEVRLPAAFFAKAMEAGFIEDNFSILAIKDWQSNANESVKELIVNTPTGETFKIAVMDNEDTLSATNWYLRNNPDTTLSQLKPLQVGSLAGVVSPDGMVAYLTPPSANKLYAFVYNLNGNSEIRYPAIFKMIIKNFKLISAPATAQ